MDKHILDVPLRVLLYEEDGEWNAHALEMDLVGSGPTPEKAESELRGAVFSQISFAAQMNDLDLIYHPAPSKYFDRWRKAQQQMLTDILEKASTECKKVRAVFIRIAPGEVRKAIKRSSFLPDHVHA
jgi:hypothetical protein